MPTIALQRAASLPGGRDLNLQPWLGRQARAPWAPWRTRSVAAGLILAVVGALVAVALYASLYAGFLTPRCTGVRVPGCVEEGGHDAPSRNPTALSTETANGKMNKASAASESASGSGASTSMANAATADPSPQRLPMESSPSIPEGASKDLPQLRRRAEAPGNAGMMGAWGGRAELEADSASACRAALAAKDHISGGRSFQKEPVGVYNPSDYEVRRCNEGECVGCEVPCVHGSDADARTWDAEMGRHRRGPWTVVRNGESRGNYPALRLEALKSLYNIVMTVHFDSDVPLVYHHYVGSPSNFFKPAPKKDPSLGLAAAFISNCNAKNFRLQAVKELQKFLKVDSYGACLNNMGRNKTDKMAALQKYKFSLAFENTNENDYVTEKFWQSLVTGAIPVVVGAPNIELFAPSNQSFLHIKSLDDVPTVAARMREIAENEGLRQSYLDWKSKGASDMFLASVIDFGAVQPYCRLCLLVADKIRDAEFEEEKRTRPCRCALRASTGNTSFVYHIFARERFTLEFKSVFLGATNFSLVGLKNAILEKFRSDAYVPTWAGRRPKVHRVERGMYRIFRVYPKGMTQEEVLHGSKWFQTDGHVRAHLEAHPCPELELIFI